MSSYSASMSMPSLGFSIPMLGFGKPKAPKSEQPKTPVKKLSEQEIQELRHDFFYKSQKFIQTKLDYFLGDNKSSYTMQTNSKQGLIQLNFQDEDQLPRLRDIKRFIEYLNVTLYLSDPDNSINAFSVFQQSPKQFIVAYDGSNYGHDPEIMRQVASDLAILSDNKSRREF